MAFQSKAIVEANPKIFKKFVKYFYQDNRFKKYNFSLYNDKFDSLYKTILDFVECDISVNNTREICIALSIPPLSDNSELVSDYRGITDDSELYKFCFSILHNNEFGIYSIEIFKLFFDKWLINNDYLPLVFYPAVAEEIKKQVVDLNDESQAIRLIKFLYLRSIDLNQIQQKSSGDSIRELLLAHESDLKTSFGLDHLYLFGSYARGLETQYSDVDLVVEASNLGTDDLRKIHSYFETILGLSIDLKDVKSMDMNALVEKIVIF